MTPVTQARGGVSTRTQYCRPDPITAGLTPLPAFHSGGTHAQRRLSGGRPSGFPVAPLLGPYLRHRQSVAHFGFDDDEFDTGIAGTVWPNPASRCPTYLAGLCWWQINRVPIRKVQLETRTSGQIHDYDILRVKEPSSFLVRTANRSNHSDALVLKFRSVVSRIGFNVRLSNTDRAQ